MLLSKPMVGFELNVKQPSSHYLPNMQRVHAEDPKMALDQLLWSKHLANGKAVGLDGRGPFKMHCWF